MAAADLMGGVTRTMAELLASGGIGWKLAS
jgi:hypothetical protein